MYSIVPARGPLESGVAPTEIAEPRPSVRAPTAAGGNDWRVSVMLGRLGRVSHYELLGVAEDAGAEAIHRRYCALLDELRARRTSSSDPGTDRKVAILMCGLAEAYEALSTSLRRRAYDAELAAARARASRPPR